MNQVSIDWLTVVVAAILNMLIGYCWYSKWLFGPTWMKLKDFAKVQPNRFTMVYAVVVSLVIAYFLAFFEGWLGVTTVVDGMFVGFCLWLGFVVTTQINMILWEKASFKLFAIHAGCKLLSFLVMSGVIGA
ncbi:MAG: DUF1761 family protein [Verrucomicrobia bacterium]|nr:DUF1761 family protein [Verrucomicrobiota bacterium]MBU6447114.1 DUF1761 family protein [Verrucomicrobiota bacterium]MDE3047902.1 DUF1761 domain-containing protein [Verrucomicrobiota bacterium]